MRVVFMGTPEFAVAMLSVLIDYHDIALVVTQPDRKAGRGKRLSAPPVKVLAESDNLPVVQPRSVRTPEFAAMLRDTGAELGVVVAYGKILPRAVLEAFPRGCINVHASLLPKYRGAAPVQWAVINGERETGVTIMHLDEGMDTGPMLLQRTMAIEPTDTAGVVLERMEGLGAEALLEALQGLEAGTLAEIAQDHDAATYAPMLTKQDGIVDWSHSAQAVSNRIRGVDPWPGAVTELDGQRLKLLEPMVMDAEGTLGQPGEVLGVHGECGLIVACGQGSCAIKTLQADGRRAMLARDFVRGRPIANGTVLRMPEARENGNDTP